MHLQKNGVYRCTAIKNKMSRYNNDDDLITNTSARIPVCLCLDTSGSMYGEPIQELEKGIKMFYDAVKDEIQTRNSCEICIVTFDSYVNVVQGYATVDNCNHNVSLDANGGTDMYEGVKKALKLLDNRKKEYNQSGVDYYQPWLIIMSDGHPFNEEGVRQLQRDIKQRETNKKLVVFPIGIGDGADMNLMAGFSKKGAIKLKGLNFKGFFEFLSKSMSIVSSSNPNINGSLKLDMSNFNGWGEI